MYVCCENDNFFSSISVRSRAYCRLDLINRIHCYQLAFVLFFYSIFLSSHRTNVVNFHILIHFASYDVERKNKTKNKTVSRNILLSWHWENLQLIFIKNSPYTSRGVLICVLFYWEAFWNCLVLLSVVVDVNQFNYVGFEERNFESDACYFMMTMALKMLVLYAIMWMTQTHRKEETVRLFYQIITDNNITVWGWIDID